MESFEFTPLGGNRPDAAVVTCAAMVLYEIGLLPDVIIPPDVLDVALAILCAPLILVRANDLDDREVHFRCAKASVRLRTVDPQTLQQLFSLSDCRSRLVLLIQLNKSYTEVPNDFLSEWAALEKVDLQETSLRCIHDNFLGGCGNLTSVKLPKSLTQISEGFLSSCEKMERIDLRNTSLQRIGNCFLHNCWNLASVELPASLKEISGYFLSSCDQLGHIDLRGTSLHQVANSFLMCCTSLTSVMLPDCLTVIADNFLSSCEKLVCIDLRNTALLRIGASFAGHCNSLGVACLPESVIEVGEHFLQGCGYVDVVTASFDVQHAAVRHNSSL